MATYGKLECQVTVPAGGWDVTLQDDGGTSTITVPAGTYYLSSTGSGSRDLLAELEYQADNDGTLTDDWTFSVAATENGTGKVTISADGSTVQVQTWDDSDLRDLLGYTSAQTGSTSYTGTNQARSLWLPDCVHRSPYGDSTSGHYETDARWTETPAGAAVVHFGRRKTVLSGLTWEAVTHAKALIAGEGTTNESMEKFYLDCILGEATWATAGGPVRYYPNAGTDSTYETYKVVGEVLRGYRPVMRQDGWTGLWTISFDRLLKVP